MEKKIIFVLLLLCLLPLFNADTISNYNVKNPVNLGQEVTAFGLFTDDANVNGDVICSFYLLDENNVLIDRADDQYTDSLGYFMSKFVITEPDFKRDSNYQVRTVCGNASSDANFLVSQRESISHTGSKEFDYITQQENLDTIFIWGIFIIIFLVIGYVGYKMLRGF